MEPRRSRRRVLQATVAASTVALAGCLPGGEEEGGEEGGEGGEDGEDGGDGGDGGY